MHVGFISSFLWSHSVGRLVHVSPYETRDDGRLHQPPTPAPNPYDLPLPPLDGDACGCQGVVAGLSRSRLSVTLLHVGSQPSAEDPVAAALSARAEAELVLPSDLARAARKVRSLGLDVVVYPELGMDTRTLLLAYRRLAPVQLVYWGHPVSQGLPSIDYFLSSELYEEPSASPPHHEQRLMLDGLTTGFVRPERPPRDRLFRPAELGLHADSHVYLLCQTLMKLHPELDEVLGRVLDGDPLVSPTALRGGTGSARRGKQLPGQDVCAPSD